MEDFSAHTHEVPHICLPDAIPGCSSSVWNWTSLLAASRNSDRPGTCDPKNTNFLFFLLGATWHVTFLHRGRVRPQILFPSQQSLVQVSRQLVFLDTYLGRQVGTYQQRTTYILSRHNPPSQPLPNAHRHTNSKKRNRIGILARKPGRGLNRSRTKSTYFLSATKT